MLLTNMIIYVVITAYLFSREYSEGTLKTILQIEIKRSKFIYNSRKINFNRISNYVILINSISFINIRIFNNVYLF